MGEDPFVYTEPAPRAYSNPFPLKLDECDVDVTTNAMLPYNLGDNEESSDPYSADHKIVTGSIMRNNMDGAPSKYAHGDMLESSFSTRPTLHHMPSLSATSCHSDSFHETGDLTGYEYSAAEPQEFAWAMHSNTFQWPNNHSLATPPLESPISFAQFHAFHPNGQDAHSNFPAAIPTPTEYYPLSATSQTSAQSITFQGFTQESPQMLYCRSSGENSQSTTPRLNSPPLVSPPTNRPAPTKIGSVSADVPTARNRRQSEADSLVAPPSTREVSRRRASTSLSATHHHLSRSPNRSHQRRSSAMPSLPISEDPFDEKPAPAAHRVQIKRSKSTSTFVKPETEDFVEAVFLQDALPPPPTPLHDQPVEVQQVVCETVSSGDDAQPNETEQLAKTKQARAESEHRRRVELKESFERLRLALNVPQPRAGKKDLVEQAISTIELNKQREMKMVSEISFLQSQLERQKAQMQQLQQHLGQQSPGVPPPKWGQGDELMENGDEMQLS